MFLFLGCDSSPRVVAGAGATYHQFGGCFYYYFVVVDVSPVSQMDRPVHLQTSLPQIPRAPYAAVFRSEPPHHVATLLLFDPGGAVHPAGMVAAHGGG